MDPEKLFRENLSLIDSVIGRVCRRARLYGADADDFASSVKLALIEDDYAILRKFQRRAALSTYLTIVVERLLADTRTRDRGRWHPSTEATRMGPAGVLLETLVLRDGRTLDEALPLVRGVDASLSRADVAAMLERLPERRARPITVDAGAAALEELIAREAADAPLLANEARLMSERASWVVRQTIAEFDPEDRGLLRLRYVAAMSIADIARMTRLPQRPLYRRFEEMLSRLRRTLRQAGVSSEEAGDVIAMAGVEGLDFGLEKIDDCPSIHGEGREAEGEQS